MGLKRLSDDKITKFMATLYETRMEKEIIEFFNEGLSLTYIKSRIFEEVGKHGFLPRQFAPTGRLNRELNAYIMRILNIATWDEYHKLHNRNRQKLRKVSHNVREGLIAQYHECKICRSYSGLVVHHMIPLTQGGKDTVDNLIVICERCHSALHNMTTPASIKILDKYCATLSSMGIGVYWYNCESCNHPHLKFSGKARKHMVEERPIHVHPPALEEAQVAARPVL